jgi:hypothetical protein
MVGAGSPSGACPAAREGGGVRERLRVSWCLPDLALVAAWVTLFYCLFLFQGYQKLFRDSDAGWHIRSGESILATGTLPRTDPYSFTVAGKPWYSWEWGADAAMGAVHRVAGLGGVAMLYALAIAAVTWLWFRLHWAMNGNFLLACAMSPMLLSTGNIHWLARPHVFSWVLLLCSLWLLESGKERVRVRDLAVACAGCALWANIHGSFFLGPLLALLYAAGQAVRPLLWDEDPATAKRRGAWYLAVAGAGAAGTFLNPFLWNLHLHVFRYLTDSDLLRRIGEFQSFDFHAEGAAQILLTLVVVVTGAVWAVHARRPEHALLMLGAAVGAMRSARALPLVALLLPLANGALTAALRKASGLRPAVRRKLDGFLAYSGRLRALDSGLSGWGVAWVMPVLLFWLLQAPAIAARTGFPPDQFPVAAASQVERLPAEARLFSPDKYGGYLIYRFEGRRKVFFDGRSDLYGAAFLTRYGRMVQVRPEWREIWGSFGFTHALVPVDYSLIPALQSIGWREVYRDRTAVLLAGPEPGLRTELHDGPSVTRILRLNQVRQPASGDDPSPGSAEG